MKIVLVGDLFIPSQTCTQELDRIARKYGASYKVLDWEAGDLEELNLRNIRVEEKGPPAEDPPDILWDLVPDADILIVHFCPVSKKLIDSSKNLEVIATMRTGLSNIDTVAAEERGIPVINLPGRLADSVSEYTIGLMIAETRNIARAHEDIRKGRWTKYFGNFSFCFELAGKTIGLVGFGEIGKKVALKLMNFSVEIIVYDPYVSEEAIRGLGAQKVELDRLMSESDIISIHTNLSGSSKRMIGKAQISLMKPTAYLINTARAAVIDKDALYTALRSNSIAGAALDVFWQEPVDMADPILQLENVTVTSHLAGTTKDALLKSIYKLTGRLEPFYERLSSGLKGD